MKKLSTLILLFLLVVSGSQAQKATNLTSKISNANLANGTTSWTATIEGTGQWTSNTNRTPAILEAYAGYSTHDMKAYSLLQNVQLEAGTYRLRGYAFYRWGSSGESDLNNADGKGARSLAYLVAGDQQKAVMRLGDVSTFNTHVYEGYANDVSAASYEFSKGNYRNELVFTLTEAKTIEIGYRGTHDRYKSWFLCGPLTLEKISDEVLTAEAATALSSAKTKYNSLKSRYATIAKQANNQSLPDGLAPYSTAAADALLASATTAEEAEAAQRALTDELGRYIRESAATFDLTSFIADPSFENTSLPDWDINVSLTENQDIGARSTSSDTYKMSGSVGSYLFNSWYSSNSTSTSHYALQILGALPAGEYALSAVVASDQAQSIYLKAYYQQDGKTVMAQSSVKSTKQTEGHELTTRFTLAEQSPLRIAGFSNYWMKMDNVRLTVPGTQALRNEMTATWKGYADIASQAIDHAAFDAAYTTALTALGSCYSEAAIRELDANLRTELLALLKTYATNTKTGYFDITPLLTNPSLDKDASGWNIEGGTTITWDASGVAERYNSSNIDIYQSLSGMPAGNYLMKVQACYRSGSFRMEPQLHDAQGDAIVQASMYLGSKSKKLLGICADGRYDSARPGSDMPGSNGQSVPNSLSGAHDAFAKGQYWNTLQTSLTTAGTLRLGLRIGTAGADSWMPFDNFRLYYGAVIPSAVMQGGTLADDTPVQSVTFRKSLTAGQFTPLCLPVNVSASKLPGKLYDIAEIKGTHVRLIETDKLCAGLPYVFLPDATQDAIKLSGVTIEALAEDKIPVLWEGGHVAGQYGKADYALYKSTADEPALGEAAADAYGVRFYDADGKQLTGALSYEVVEPTDVRFTFNVENEKVRAYLAKAKYDQSSASIVAGYDVPTPGRRDVPHVAVIPVPKKASTQKLAVTGEAYSYTATIPANVVQYEVRNLIPGYTYSYSIDGVKCGEVTAEGQLRMIKAPTVPNIRDLGGWPVGNYQRIRYGMIFRGGEFNGTSDHIITAEDRNILLNEVGLKADLDLRSWVHDNVNCHTSSGLNTSGVNIDYRASNQWDSGDWGLKADTARTKFAENFYFLSDHVIKGQPAYFHCVWGADRTGSMSFLLEGLLGQPIDQLYKNYELTSFSSVNGGGLREKPGLDSRLNYILSLPGDDLPDKFYGYFRDTLGIPTATLDKFRAVMLEDIPNVVAVAQSDYQLRKARYAEMLSRSGLTWNTTEADRLMAEAQNRDGVVKAFGALGDAFAKAAKGHMVDATPYLINSDFSKASAEGWTTATAPAFGEGLAEYYEKVASLSQDVDLLPPGRYTAKVQGFMRPALPDDAYKQFFAGDNRASSVLRLNSATATLHHAADEARTAYVVSSDSKPAAGWYFPMWMVSVTKYFNEENLYWNVVETDIDDLVTKASVGLSTTVSDVGSWTVFDNFRLYYNGVGRQTLRLLPNEEFVVPKEGYLADVILPELQDGQWAMLTLPVTLSAKECEALGLDEVQYLTRVSTDATDKTRATATFVKSQYGMLAGRPYLVHCAKGGALRLEQHLVDTQIPLTVAGTISTACKFVPTYAPTLSDGDFYLGPDARFHRADSELVPAFSAVLTLPASMANLQTIVINGLDYSDIDGVEAVTASPTDAARTSAVYDLSGRRVSKAKAGLYIVGGRKVVVK